MDDLVHLARLSLTGREQDVHLYVRRLARRYQQSAPALSTALEQLLVESPTRSTPLRRETAAPVPVDQDSRLQLLRTENITELDVQPVFPADAERALNQIVEERASQDKLLRAGLAPTRSVLLTGPPGVGKTLSSRWLAQKLKVPLLTLDLAAVMSSYLGRTGNNLRYVLDYAKGVSCILLLDEFDAMAKRRDDSTEIGELKRLVTVLLQEIDQWPPTGLLIAATNHPDLLDPAVWRRFEMKIEFSMPDRIQARAAISQWAGHTDSALLDALAILFEGHSFSEMERSILLARRAAAMQNQPLDDHLRNTVSQFARSMPRKLRGELATKLVASGRFSQREAHELTGVSRDTIRKAQQDQTQERE